MPDNVVKMPASRDDPEGLELVLNSRYERRADGTWLATLAPLERESDLPTLEARAGTADEARARLIQKYTAFYYGGSEEADERVDYASRYGRWIPRKFLHSLPWPPAELWVNIDRIALEAPEASGPQET